MARSTALDLITASLKDIGVLAAGETASAGDSSDGLDSLNALIDQWKAEKLMIYTVTRSTVAITANDGVYTIGAAGDINVVRPVFIEDIRFVDTSQDPDYEYPLDVLTEQAYAAIPMKAQTSTYPESRYYNPTFPTGTINLFPIPTSSTLTLVVYHWTAVTTFATLATAFSLPPAYERMIVKNLAVELAPSYEREPSQALMRQASDSMAVVKRGNLRLSDLSFETAALIGRDRGAYNIRQN